jgi:hypothetical protein
MAETKKAEAPAPPKKAEPKPKETPVRTARIRNTGTEERPVYQSR